MPSEGSVTRWLDPLRAGDPIAADRLWERFFQRLARLALNRLRAVRSRAEDEEDVALSAFHSFCRHAAQGRFPYLHDRNSLWRLLAVITARKAARRVQADKRRRPSCPVSDPSEIAAIEELLSREPTPEFIAQMKEACRVLLAKLHDRQLEDVAIWRMESFSVDEIAAKLGCAPRSVKRKLALIRDAWREDIGP